MVPAPLAGQARAAAEEGERVADAAAAAGEAHEAEGPLRGPVEEPEADVLGPPPLEDVALNRRRPLEDAPRSTQAAVGAGARRLAAAERASDGAPGRRVEDLQPFLVPRVSSFQVHPRGIAQLLAATQAAMRVKNVVTPRPVAVAKPATQTVNAPAAKAHLLGVTPTGGRAVDKTVADPIRGPSNDPRVGSRPRCTSRFRRS